MTENTAQSVTNLGYHAHIYYDPTRTRAVAEGVCAAPGAHCQVEIEAFRDTPRGPHPRANVLVIFYARPVRAGGALPDGAPRRARCPRPPADRGRGGGPHGFRAVARHAGRTEHRYRCPTGAAGGCRAASARSAGGGRRRRPPPGRREPRSRPRVPPGATSRQRVDDGPLPHRLGSQCRKAQTVSMARADLEEARVCVGDAPCHSQERGHASTRGDARHMVRHGANSVYVNQAGRARADCLRTP